MGKILQLKITLKEIKPKIWRRFLVDNSISFHNLHNIIQEVMGWGNYHLYSFDINSKRIELPDENGCMEYEGENSKKIKINKYLKGEKQKINYVYDFGDSWEHEIVVEKILENPLNGAARVPLCLEGERAYPPEDCGGVGGYERILIILSTGKDPWGDEPKELKEWLGDWKPDEFDSNDINKKLK